LIRPEISKTIINDRVRVLRAEAKDARRARIAKALKR
jgi:hypothetical protein